VNNATGTGIPPTGPPETGTSTTTTPIAPEPGMTLEKQAGTPTGNRAGATIGYRFVVTNTGNVTLTDITVNDPKVGAVDCPRTTLAAGETLTCTATYTLTSADVTAGEVVNTATATGTPPTGEPVTPPPSTTTTPLTPEPRIAVEKTSDADGQLEVGELVTFRFEVTNTGDLDLTDVTVTDRKVESVTCPTTTLAPGESTTCTSSPYTVTADDTQAGVIVNTAVASADCGEGCAAPTAVDTVEVPTDPAPPLARTGPVSPYRAAAVALALIVLGLTLLYGRRTRVVSGGASIAALFGDER
jgi:uncharacterized repeat protein (TIGR01451 family)